MAEWSGCHPYDCLTFAPHLNSVSSLITRVEAIRQEKLGTKGNDDIVQLVDSSFIISCEPNTWGSTHTATYVLANLCICTVACNDRHKTRNLNPGQTGTRTTGYDCQLVGTVSEACILPAYQCVPMESLVKLSDTFVEWTFRIGVAVANLKKVRVQGICQH